MNKNTFSHRILPEEYRFNKEGKLRNRWIVMPSIVKYYEIKENYVDTDTGEVFNKIEFVGKDCERFIKLYDLSFARGVSQQASNLVVYILDNLRYGNYVIINKKEYAKKYEVSEKYVYKIIKELSDRFFIYKDIGNVYFVNPNFVSLGSRQISSDEDIKNSIILGNKGTS